MVFAALQRPKLLCFSARGLFASMRAALLCLCWGAIISPHLSATEFPSPQPQSRAAVDRCLANLPSPTPFAPSHRVVQLVNCSNQTLLGAANAAGKPGVPLTSVLPREKTWVMKPFGAANNLNVLTIDIPPEWEATIGPGATGPRLWTRTGCRYDISSDRAQCETGGCAGVYDCSKAKLGASVGTTVSEWTFYQHVTSPDGTISYFKDSPDISAVDGVNLTMDIQPVGGTSVDPFDAQGGHDIQWLAENYPLTQHGMDLRADNLCIPAFRLLRSDLTSGIYGFVIINNKGKPVGGDATVACFSNCGRYAFPTTPDQSCDDSDHNSKCYRWKSFCLADAAKYGMACQTDQDCPEGGGCWNNPGSALDHTCQGRAFIKQQTCPSNICTFPYGYVDPKNNQKYYSTQPPFGHCTDVAADPAACIGDDTIHSVLNKAYTWPNDPQTYADNATLYRVVFAPGGTSVPITPAGPIPVCSTLPAIYGYAAQYGGPNSGTKPCDISVNKNKAVFAVAHPQLPPPAPPVSWACNLAPTGAGNEGVICRWKPGGVTRVPR
ncbi:hypothetical protein CR492_13840 [Methylocella silvestris]|uniref:Thaumatin pathogenesis-related protein n=1 Tax=Methylocella silvestris TaxID=199596 RepID=A0A2J7TF54_METSI|nr:hypothetical protein CR492_13840 [Methylocella silvestris]